MGDQVYQHLRDMILSLQIKPGERVPESKIANQFGISRTPIREAIKQLANDGIVTIYPNRYSEVSVLEPKLMQEIGSIRIALDVVAARLAILYGSNYDYAQMDRLNEACFQAAMREDMATRIKMNCAFHLELNRISQNTELFMIQKRLYLKLEFMQACCYANVETKEEQYRQHKSMMEALYNRDADKLISLLTLHERHFHAMSEEPPLTKDLGIS